MLRPPVHQRTRKKAAKNRLFAKNSFQYNYLPPGQQLIRATCTQDLLNKRVYNGAVAPGLRVGRGLEHATPPRFRARTIVAPGLRVGRGLEHLAIAEVPDSHVLLRPAYGSGEDWNRGSKEALVPLETLRPAYGSGEDWNPKIEKRSGYARGLRPAYGSGEDWNSRLVPVLQRVPRLFKPFRLSVAGSPSRTFASPEG